MKNKKRYIVIGSERWEYKIGKSYAHIWTPRGKKVIINSNTVNGTAPFTFERGQYKRTSDGMVTPKDVREYIEKNLIGSI